MSRKELCPICGKAMRRFNDHDICVNCNDRYGDYYNFFANAVKDFKKDDGEDNVLIECPGATIYDENNGEVVEGVKWIDPLDFSKGHKIMGKPVYAPNHQPKRLIPRDKANNICRCRACQDLTIRMRTHNNQKRRHEYHQDSPMMPRYDPGKGYSPLASQR